MSQRTTGRIDVGPDDALPDLLLRVKATRGDEVVIGIPDTSSVLITASEFRTLKSTAEQVRVSVRLETNDKLRAQLASMFGFPGLAIAVGPGHDPRRRPDYVEAVARGGG
jgi:hypothetical protein